MKKILWVDDHEMLCVALSEYVEQHAVELSTESIETKAVFSLAEAIRLVSEPPLPSLVFLDLNLGAESSGADTLRLFQASNPNKVPVVICTGLSLCNDTDIDVLRTCLRDHGAQGILLKGGAHKKMFVGLGRLLQGELFIPEDVMMRFACIGMVKKADSPQRHLGLTPREWEVAVRIGRGLPGKEIARDLNIAPGHVRQVSCIIYDKLCVRNRTEAALKVNAELAAANGSAQA
jgi:two-component system nitrate/nitrite response regulator NarL